MINLDALDERTLLALAAKLPEMYARSIQIEQARASLIDYVQFYNPEYEVPPHIKLLSDKLEAVERGDIKRLAISMPPRHGKTMLTSKYFPAWYMGRNPRNFLITCTYAQDLAEDMGREVKDQINSEEFQMVFPGLEMRRDSSAAKNFKTNKGGVYVAVGANGIVTGRGAHLFLVDDPIKGDEDADSPLQRQKLINWYQAVVTTRMMGQQGRGSVVLIGTRWHEEDLIGWALKETAHEGWEVINLPGIAVEEDILGRKPGEPLWPEKFPLERLSEIKQTLGNRYWYSLYQQSPHAEDGNVFKRGWWKRVDVPLTMNFDYVIQSLDTAYTEKKVNDCSAITTWGVYNDDDDVPHAVLIDLYNDRLEYPDLRKKAQELYHKHKPDIVVIENKSSGIGLIQDLRRAGIPLTTFTPDKDKLSRAYSVQTLVESGRVIIPNTVWGEELIYQASVFPNGKFDDIVDSLVMALIRLKQGWMVRSAYDPEDEEEEETAKATGYWR